jgi:DNA (cytosine-5)-methyltransferase 3A
VRLKKECNPSFFLLENVRMKEKYEAVFNKYMEVLPLEINSALVSAQSRQRLYWTNIGCERQGLFGTSVCTIPQPKDKKIVIKDILEKEVDEKYFLSQREIDYLKRAMGGKHEEFRLTFMNYEGADKSICVTQNFHRGVPHNMIYMEEQGIVNKKRNNGKNIWKDNLIMRLGCVGNSTAQANRVYDIDGKTPSLQGEAGGWGAKTGLYLERGRIRKLTPKECERLQTVPDNYTDCVSDTQRYRMLGNGWTVDVIAHILGYLPIELRKQIVID